MSSSRPREEKTASEAQVPPQLPNCISFHGTIVSEIVDVGGGFFAFSLEGDNKEEFPVFLLKTTKEYLSQNLIEGGDKVAGIGILEKVQEQWAIEILQINRIPPQDEIETYK